MPGDPKPEADVGNLAGPITDVVSSTHRQRGMTVSGQERTLRVDKVGVPAPHA
jgi:hypothetical protein